MLHIPNGSLNIPTGLLNQLSRAALNNQLQAEKRLTGVTQRAARLAGTLGELTRALCDEFGRDAEKPVDPEAEIPLFGSPKPKCSATVQVCQHMRDYCFSLLVIGVPGGQASTARVPIG